MEYFEEIVANLKREELSILGILHENGIDKSFKSMSRKTLMITVELTEAKFRKSISKLDALRFIDTVADEREHLYKITPHGVEAINKSIEGEDE